MVDRKHNKVVEEKKGVSIAINRPSLGAFWCHLDGFARKNDFSRFVGEIFCNSPKSITFAPAK